MKVYFKDLLYFNSSRRFNSDISFEPISVFEYKAFSSQCFDKHCLHKHTKMGKYEAISLIGEGSFGTVYKGKVVETNEIVALKIIVKVSILNRNLKSYNYLLKVNPNFFTCQRGREAKELKGLKRECEIQRTLNHPNIIRMLDSFETVDTVSITKSAQ